VGGLSLVNSGDELYEYIGEAPPEEEVVLPTPDTGSDTGLTWAQQQAEQLGEATVASELFDATFYGMNSLLFDGESYLTPFSSWGPNSDTDSKTWSLWIKRSGAKFGSNDYFLGAFVSPYTDTFDVAFNTDNKLICQWGGSDSQSRTNISSGTYKDISWHHIVISQAPTSCSIFVDGEKIELGTSSNPSGSPEQFLKAPGSGNYGSFIGGGGFGGGNSFNGHMANIQFIDGMSLDASYFGQYMGANWAPKKYEGAYGANGFWLDFSKTQWDSVDENNNPTAASNLQTVEDVSGNGNHWSAA
jgi:hypothetical protein